MCDPLNGAIILGSALAKAAPVLVPAITAGVGYEETRKARSMASDAAQSAQDQAQDQFEAQTEINDTRYDEQQDLMEQERIRAQEREDALQAERDRLRKEEDDRKQRIADGRAAVSDVFGQTFTPGFYDQQQQAFLDFQNPQLEDQYKDAGSQLLFALSRSGLGQSSSMNQRQAQLQGTYTQASQDIIDEAARRRAQTEAAVNQQQQALMNQAEGAQDPSYMRGLAQSQSASLSAPQDVSNLGDVFATALSGITSIYDQERRKQSLADRQRRAAAYGISGEGPTTIVS